MAGDETDISVIAAVKEVEDELTKIIKVCLLMKFPFFIECENTSHIQKYAMIF